MIAPSDGNTSVILPYFLDKNRGKTCFDLFTLLEIVDRCSAAGSHFHIILAGVNAPLEFPMGYPAGSKSFENA